MDVLARVGDLDVTRRHDGAAPTILAAARATKDARDAVLGFWQVALTAGTGALGRTGKPAPRPGCPAELGAALRRLADVMGPLTADAAAWVGRIAADPTTATATAAAEWWRTLPNPPAAKRSEGDGEGTGGEPGGGGAGDGAAPGRRETRVTPTGCGGEVPEFAVTDELPRAGTLGATEPATWKRSDPHAERKLTERIEAAVRTAASRAAAERQEAEDQTDEPNERAPLAGLLPREANPAGLIHDHIRRGVGTRPVKLRRGTRIDGSSVLRPERWRAGDRCVFAASRPGGAMAIDISGSMGWDWDALSAAMRELPGLTVAAHGAVIETGADGSERRCPRICILARDGRWAEPVADEWDTCNMSDLEALEWLARQRGPRIWLSDGEAHSGRIGGGMGGMPPTPEGRATALAIARTAQIVRVRRIEDALAICHHRTPKGAVRTFANGSGWRGFLTPP
jgi:hypothetical protein